MLSTLSYSSETSCNLIGINLTYDYDCIKLLLVCMLIVCAIHFQMILIYITPTSASLNIIFCFNLASLSEDSAGYVEVEFDGDSGYVCGDKKFNDDAAQVICVSLGYDGGHVACSEEVDEFGDADSDTPILLKKVDCSGEEDNLGSCDAEEFDCEDDDCENIAAVVCGKCYISHNTFNVIYHITLSMLYIT